MNIAITGGTGFLGRYILSQLLSEGHQCRAWKREDSDISGFEGYASNLEWLEGNLTDIDSMKTLLEGTDAVVHAALHRRGNTPFQSGGDTNFIKYMQANLMGTLSLISTAKKAGVKRFIFISSCAVHDLILPDRLLDETHPLYPYSHYGAYKGAVENFVHSFGLGEGWDICSLRPSGIYGLAVPPQKSKWFDLIQRVKRGETIEEAGGGKEVHGSDVAKAVSILLKANGIAGQVCNCSDMYIADQEVAKIASKILNSKSVIKDINEGPKNRIDTKKIESLGMSFGGDSLLKETIKKITCFI